MTIQIDPARVTSSADSIEARAREFEARWQEWRADADRVIDGLGASAASMRLARDDLCSADTSAGDAILN